MPVRRVLLITVCLGALGLGACTPPIGTAANAPAAPPTPDPAPAVKVAAMVNGQAIPLEKLHEWLVSAHGVTAINQLIGTVVVDQAAAAEGITVSEADVEAETTLSLQQMNPNLTPDQYDALLNQLLVRKGVPRIQWDASMRRNAFLRKMAARQVQVTDEMLREEFNNRYGMKVQIRLIQCESASDAQKILQAMAMGESFADLATKYSMLTESAREGGLIPPFARDDKDVPLAIRTAAFDLADGDVSGIIRVSKYFHVIQRARSTPPETDIAFEDVKESLREELAARLIQQMQQRILQDLLNRADVVLIDPQLKRQAALKGPETSAP